MYTVVLMAALTTGVDLPDRGGRRGGGCCGCYGGGGGGHGRRGGRGGGCCGCYGGGYGYGGGCMGMGMGYGGCMGMGYGGGCMGMGMGYGGGCMGMGMGYGGGCMGMGCYGGGMGLGGGVILQGGGAAGQAGERIKTKPKTKDEESLAPTPATILVQLPTEAKLRIDNEATTSTGDSRVFQTPALKPGKEYHYTLTAEIIREGKPVKAEQVVAVKAGQITPVTITLPRIGVAQR